MGVEQARQARPFTSTRQAPQAACPEQPSLAAVRRRSRRRKEGSRRVAAVIDALPVEPERNHGDSPQEGGKAGQGNFLEKGEYLPVSLSPRLHPFTDFRV